MSRLRAGAVAGAGLVLALAATVGPSPTPSAAPGASLLLRMPEVVWMIVLGLSALSLLLLLSLQRPRRPTEDEVEPEKTGRRPHPFALLASLAVMLLLIYLAWTHWAPGAGHPLDAPLAALAGLLDLLAQARKAPTSVPAFDYAVAGLALLLAFTTFAVMILVVFAERIMQWWAAPARRGAGPRLEDAVVESLDDLRAEPDARAAIIRAYRRFELALSAARAPRAIWQTPSEFMRAALAQVPVPRPAVERITRLFELARFSDQALGADARNAACDCLDEVKAALETDRMHGR